jgi:tetratricopeptide (TPR) repeat protein
MSSIRLLNKSSRQQPFELTGHLLKWGIPLIVVVLTMAAFYPVTQNKFINWDDYKNFVENPHYRGLGWTNIRWMFTTFHMGHYQPLTWVTLGLDYVLWGLNPFGYHLTSLILHAATAVAFFFLARQLLSIATGSGQEGVAVWVGAAVAALLFALHPLRVESVAWATERRDVLSGLFYTLTILVYLNASRAAKLRRRWYWAAWVLFLCAVLSKSLTVTLPAVLLILDIYPLRRLGGSSGWWSERARAVYWEKVPFVLLSAVASAVAFIALAQIENMASLQRLGILDRLTVSAYSLWFYFWKTVAPFNLSPLYELPSEAELSKLSFMLSYVVVVLAIALGLALRRRLPGVGVAGLTYAVTLLPVLGIFQNGPQITADRYSYLSCMGWAVLAGACGQYFWQASLANRMRKRTFVLGSWVIVVILSGLGFLTWRQTHVWHDPEKLWNHVLATTGESLFARNNLGNALTAQGRFGDAMEQFHKALRIDPNDADATYNLGNALAQQGSFEEAAKQLQHALQINPGNAMAAYDLGNVRAKQERFEEAIEQFRGALEIDPGLARAHYNIGSLLTQQGKLNEAIAHFRQVMLLAPEDARSPYNLGQIFAKQGKFDEAIRHFRLALRLAPANVKARYYLAVALAGQGDFEAASKEFRESLRIEPSLAEAHAGLARALSAQGKKDEAVRHYQEAVRILQSQNATPPSP